jgi:hypothetical protein
MLKVEYRVAEFKFQLGLAITLPTPGLPTVFVKSREYWDANPWLRAHEEVHVAQVYRLGPISYVLVHLWARLQTRNLWGVGHWIEDEAYKAGNDAREQEHEV